MVRLGRYFQAPSQRATRQWLKVELLYRHGEHFETSTPSRARHYATLTDVIAYLAKTSGGEEAVRTVLDQIRAERARPKRDRKI